MAIQAIKFYNKEGKDFNSELKDRVNQYFKSNHLSPNSNATMVIKTITIFTAYFRPLPQPE